MRFLLQKYLHPILLTLAAVALAFKPVVVGTSSYGVVGWLTVGLTLAGAFGTYWVPNLEGQAAVAVKDVVAILTVGFAAAINVAPNGFSRADLWTVGAALVGVGVPLLIGSASTASVQAPGPGCMGDKQPDVHPL